MIEFSIIAHLPEWSKGPHSRCGESYSREFKSHSVQFFYFYIRQFMKYYSSTMNIFKISTRNTINILLEG